MRPSILLLLLLAFSANSLSQSQPLPRPKFIEFDGDLCRIHLRADGGISDECASFTRVGKLHPTIINIEGDFADYDLEGHLILRASMSNNELNGPATYYYPDGKIRETGRYLKNKRDSIWTSYYANGVVQKVMIYRGEVPLIWEASEKNGKKSVTKGFGDFRTEIQLEDYSNFDHIAKGEIRNGKLHGEWVLISPSSLERITREYYHEGEFIRGKRKYGEEYTTHPAISFERYSAHENVSLLENQQLCQWPYASPLRYKNELLHYGFYPMLTRKLSKELPNCNDQWVMVQFLIDESDRIGNIGVRSSIHDTNVENFISSFLKSSYEWEGGHTREKIPTSVFFTILFDKGSIIIPANLLHHRNLEKIFYNDANEITVEEMSSHYRLESSVNSHKGFVNKCLEFDRSGNKYMEVNYSQDGKKEGRFIYERYGKTIETTFSNDKPNGYVPDSILMALAQKERFIKAKYIRKGEYGRIMELLEPGFQTNGFSETLVLDPEIMPQFPGGTKSLSEFLAFHLVVPEQARIRKIKGSVTLEIAISADGRPYLGKVIKGLGYRCDEAAIEAVHKLPDWIPGKKNGKPVPVLTIIEVPFYTE